jgi:hypothetical protein
MLTSTTSPLPSALCPAYFRQQLELIVRLGTAHLTLILLLAAKSVNIGQLAYGDSEKHLSYLISFSETNCE